MNGVSGNGFCLKIGWKVFFKIEGTCIVIYAPKWDD